MTVVIEGLSLSLSIVLAAWAASQRLHLRRVVATGDVTAGGQICEVREIPQKVNAAQAYAEALNIDALTMLVPPDNATQAKGCDATLVKINAVSRSDGQPETIDISTAEELFGSSKGLLTDGFDEYRSLVLKAVAQTPVQEDEHRDYALNQFTDPTWLEVSQTPEMPLVFPIPFGDDPQQAAIATTKLIWAKLAKDQSPSADQWIRYRVAVPVELNALAPATPDQAHPRPAREAIATALAKAIRKGVSKVTGECPIDGLSDTVRCLADKLLLVIHGRHNDFQEEDERSALQGLRKWYDASNGTPALVFVASSLGHARFLRDAWARNGGTPSPEPAARR